MIPWYAEEMIMKLESDWPGSKYVYLPRVDEFPIIRVNPPISMMELEFINMEYPKFLPALLHGQIL